jgi:predicted permease
VSAVAKRKGRLVGSLVVFAVVAALVLLAGMIATTLLKTVVLPLLAVLLGWFAARVFYRMGDY